MSSDDNLSEAWHNDTRENSGNEVERVEVELPLQTELQSGPELTQELASESNQPHDPPAAVKVVPPPGKRSCSTGLWLSALGIFLIGACLAAAAGVFYFTRDQRAYKNAVALAEAGQYAEAISAYETIQADFPDSKLLVNVDQDLPEIYIAWSEQLEAAKQYPESLEKIETGLERCDSAGAGSLQARLPEIHATWGQDLLADKNFAAAADQFNFILDNYPASTQFQAAKNDVFSTYKEWCGSFKKETDYKVLNDYLAGIAKTPGHPSAVQAAEGLAYTNFELGKVYVQKKEFKSAVDLFLSVLKKYPKTNQIKETEKMLPQTYYQWALNLEADQQVQEAIDTYLIIVHDYPKSEQSAQAAVRLPIVYEQKIQEFIDGGRLLDSLAEIDQIQASPDSRYFEAAVDPLTQKVMDALSRDTSDGLSYINNLLFDYCAGQTVDSPIINIAKDEDGKALVCNGAFTLDSDLTASMPAHFRYYIDVMTDYTLLNTCEYSETGYGTVEYTLDRMRTDYTVSVYSVDDQSLVNEKTFSGAAPEWCPATHYFAADNESLYGPDPESSTINEWLHSQIK